MASTNILQSGSTSAVKVYVSVNELSTNGNYRTLYMSVCAYPEDGYGHLDRDGLWEFYFEGEANDSGSTIINNNGMWMFESSSVEVYVAPGETFANVNISFSATLKSPSAGSKTVTGTITRITGLSMVADASITSVKDIYFGENCNVVFTPASSSFHYKLQFSMGDFLYTTDVISPNSDSAYTYSELVIPEEVASNIPSSEYGSVAVSLTQYSDSAGTKSVGAASVKSFRVMLKDTEIPIITSYSVEIDNSDNEVLDMWGIPLAGYTKLKVGGEAVGIHGSTIESFTIYGPYNKTVVSTKNEGETYSFSYTGKSIGISGNKKFRISCTDSRGRVSNEIETDLINFLPYTMPKIKKVSIKKNDFGNDNVEDDRIVLTATWDYDPVSIDGVAYNSTSARVRYKISTAADWTDYSDGINPDYIIDITNGEPYTLENLKLDEKLSYNIELVITDAIGNVAKKEGFSSTVQVLMDFQAGGKGLGIGKVCEIKNIEDGTQSLEISMDSYFFGEVFIRDKTQTLEDYIKNITKYLVEYEDYGDDNPNNISWETPPKAGQIYYMRIQEG